MHNNQHHDYNRDWFKMCVWVTVLFGCILFWIGVGVWAGWIV